jgi:hypothetical protein
MCEASLLKLIYIYIYIYIGKDFESAQQSFDCVIEITKVQICLVLLFCGGI